MRKVSALFVLVAVILAGCGGSKANTITVGSMDFTESIIMGELLAQVIEAQTDLPVERKLSLGGSMVNYDGIKSGDVDLYLEYDGTVWAAHLGHTEAPPVDLLDAVRTELAEHGATMTAPLGFNNTYALAMPRELAEAYGVETYSDLALVADELVFGATNEFMARETDGFLPMAEAYGFEFAEVVQMAAGLRYPAIEAGELQVISAFATDGNLREYDMVILEDDKSFFPPYYAAPLVRLETLEAHPELGEALALLEGLLDDSTMQELNYRVAVEQEDEAEVVRSFLTSVGLLEE